MNQRAQELHLVGIRTSDDPLGNPLDRVPITERVEPRSASGRRSRWVAGLERWFEGTNLLQTHGGMMSETTDEPGGEDEQYPDERYGGTGQPDDNDDEPDDEPDANDLERALDSVREVEDG
jgi:hypothetical protein